MLLVPNTNKYYVVGVSFHVTILMAHFVNDFQVDTLSSDKIDGILVSRN